MLLKVCGMTRRGDVDLLDAADVDLAGLWFGVPGGQADLSLDQLAALAGTCRDTGHLAPVMVTFLKDPDVLVAAARYAGISWLQLHSYQPPGLVAALKRAAPELTVVKVLHVHRGTCVEQPLIGSYEKAGSDLFLLDATTDAGRIGSTGQALESGVVLDLAERMTVPFLLAGGISAASRVHYDEVVTHPRFAGVDVDSAARDGTGSLSVENVHTIRRHWPIAESEAVL